MIRFLGLIVFVLLIGLWVRTIIDIVRTQDYQYRAGNQVVWLLVVILVPIIGVPLYWILGAPQRR
jgi:hypothetical protein